MASLLRALKNTSFMLCLFMTIVSCTEKEEITPPIVINPKIIAHCGFWDTNDSCQNSISSLRNAGELGVYATEFDVHITKDNVLVISHDAIVNGVNIHDTSYETLHNDNFLLSNGEYLPNIDEYFTTANQYPDLKLVIELKSDEDPEYEKRAILTCIRKIKEYQLQNRVLFISFSLSACTEFNRLFPEIDVLYLNGDKSPQELFDLGLDGMNYHYQNYYMNPHWIKNAYQLGLKVATWTVDDVREMEVMLSNGVEYLATNKPDIAMQILEKYKTITIE